MPKSKTKEQVSLPVLLETVQHDIWRIAIDLDILNASYSRFVKCLSKRAHRRINGEIDPMPPSRTRRRRRRDD